LYELQKGKKSEWYHLIHNLSKDIDTVLLWDDKDLELLDDPHFVKIIKRTRKKEFDDIFNEITSILSKYPNFFNKETYSWENFRWLFTHIITRCFGLIIMQDTWYLAMIPFAEFLNHENTDLYYEFEY